VVAVVAGLVASHAVVACLAAVVMRWRTIRRADLRHYDVAHVTEPVPVPVDHLTATRALVDVYDEAAHERRMHHVWREHAAELSRDLAAAREQIARLTRRRLPASPRRVRRARLIPDYGEHFGGRAAS
jgi:hypothetical protein